MNEKISSACSETGSGWIITRTSYQSAFNGERYLTNQAVCEEQVFYLDFLH